MPLDVEYRCKLQKVRLEKGLTQEQLAEKLGTAVQTIAHYEKNRRRLSFPMAARIAAVLDVSMWDLVDLKVKRA